MREKGETADGEGKREERESFLPPSFAMSPSCMPRSDDWTFVHHKSCHPMVSRKKSVILHDPHNDRICKRLTWFRCMISWVDHTHHGRHVVGV